MRFRWMVGRLCSYRNIRGLITVRTALVQRFKALLSVTNPELVQFCQERHLPPAGCSWFVESIRPQRIWPAAMAWPWRICPMSELCAQRYSGQQQSAQWPRFYR